MCSGVVSCGGTTCRGHLVAKAGQAGSKRVIAFYVPDRGHCTVDVVIWNNARGDYLIANFWPDAVYSAARVRINVDPGEIAEINGDEDQNGAPVNLPSAPTIGA